MKLIMQRHHPYILLPLGVSLIIHGALAGGLLWGYSHELAALLNLQPLFARPAAALVVPDPQRPDRMGEALGQGLAVNAAPGELLSQSRQAEQEQADLSRDPEGLRIGDPPSRRIGPVAVLAAATPPGAPAPFGVAAEVAPSAMPVHPPRLPPGLIARERKSAEVSAEKRPAATMPAAPGAPSSASVALSAPVPVAGNQSADPLPESDSESDAFSNVGTVEVRQGRVEARFGRKVKTTRPRISIAGTLDLMSLDYPTVVLKVKTDATGKVTSVGVLRSSGSVDLDHPTEMAVYDWWIEPPKDKDGHPLPDVMVWKISFR